MRRRILGIIFLAYLAPVVLHSGAEAGHVIANPADCTGTFGGKIVCFEAYDPYIRDQLFIRDIDQLNSADSAAVRDALVEAESDWNALGSGPQHFAILPNIADVYNYLKPSSPQATGGGIALTRRCGTVVGNPDVCISDLGGPPVNAEWTEVLTLVDPVYGTGLCFPCQPYAGQKRLVLHEWGHVLGLRHHGNCTDVSPALMCEGAAPSGGQALGSIEAGSTADCKSGGSSSDDGIRCVYDWYNCSDSDCDNVTSSVDNCPAAPNQTQGDADGESFALSPVYPWPDVTNVVAYDHDGDICDDDDDGDGLSTAQELLFVPCYPVSTGPTDPLNDDTDGDRIKDGVECLVGSDPVNPNSKPATSPDQDNDGLQDGLEFLVFNTSITDSDSDNDYVSDGAEALRYGSDPNDTNSDSGVEYFEGLPPGAATNCGDRREAATVNNDYSATAGDLGAVASKFGAYSGYDHRRRDLDFNRDGSITAGDLAQVASAFGACP